MPSFAAIQIMAGMGVGAAAAGYGGYRYAQNRQDLDRSDRLGMTAMSTLGGAAAGGALAYAGPFRVAGAATTGANFVRKALFSNPVKDFIRGESRGRQVSSIIAESARDIKAFKPVAKGGMNRLSGISRYGGVMAAVAAIGIGTIALGRGITTRDRM